MSDLEETRYERGTQTAFCSLASADDAVKETFLAEVGGSYADDETALERVNREYSAARRSGGSVVVRAPITQATVRTWTRDDEEFAEALKVARQMRDEARALGLDKPQHVPDPGLWPTTGRLDQRPDPYRAASTVEQLLGLSQ